MAKYELKLKREYTASGRQIKNIGGTVVIFYDGVASNVGDDVAQRARRQHYIDSVEEVAPAAPAQEGFVAQVAEKAAEVAETTQEAVKTAVQEVEESVEEVTEEVVEQVEQAVEVVEASEEAPVERADEPVVEVSDKVVADVPETEDGLLTRTEIESLYEELGTWTAVADHLDISTSTLRKYREEVGLA